MINSNSKIYRRISFWFHISPFNTFNTFLYAWLVRLGFASRFFVSRHSFCVLSFKISHFTFNFFSMSELADDSNFSNIRHAVEKYINLLYSQFKSFSFLLSNLDSFDKILLQHPRIRLPMHKPNNYSNLLDWNEKSQ